MKNHKNQSQFKPLPKWEFLESIIGLKGALNFYPPYVGAGIQVESVSEDFSTIQVKMCLEWWNENYVGVHFGGSLYSMCDPWYMLILMKKLNHSYMVWDKEAHIQFIKPGKGCVRANFHIPDEEVIKIKEILNNEKKTIREYQTEILDETNQTIAKVKKFIYIRRLS